MGKDGKNQIQEFVNIVHFVVRGDDDDGAPPGEGHGVDVNCALTHMTSLGGEPLRSPAIRCPAGTLQRPYAVVMVDNHQVSPEVSDRLHGIGRPLSALPSPLARAIAFISIVIGGVAGGLIGFALVDIQYSGSSTVPRGLGILVGAIVAAGGTAIIAVLVLRALGEWRDISTDASRRT